MNHWFRLIGYSLVFWKNYDTENRENRVVSNNDEKIMVMQ